LNNPPHMNSVATLPLICH